MASNREVGRASFRPRSALKISCGALLTVLSLGDNGSAQEASLSAPRVVLPGVPFEVDWRGPGAKGDFIAIAEPGSDSGSFLAYARTSGGSPARLTAPEAGDYEIRYILASDLAVLANLGLTVGEAAARAITAPSRVPAGARLGASVVDPGAPADYLTIVESGSPDHALGPYARLRGAREVSLAAPETPGSYEIRQVRAADMTILERARLEVVAPGGTASAGPAVEPRQPTGQSTTASRAAEGAEPSAASKDLEGRTPDGTDGRTRTATRSSALSDLMEFKGDARRDAVRSMDPDERMALLNSAMQMARNAAAGDRAEVADAAGASAYAGPTEWYDGSPAAEPRFIVQPNMLAVLQYPNPDDRHLVVVLVDEESGETLLRRDYSGEVLEYVDLARMEAGAGNLSVRVQDDEGRLLDRLQLAR